MEQGRLDDAWAAFRRVIELDPLNVDALSALAELASATGRMDEAALFDRRAREAAQVGGAAAVRPPIPPPAVSEPPPAVSEPPSAVSEPERPTGRAAAPGPFGAGEGEGVGRGASIRGVPPGSMPADTGSGAGTRPAPGARVERGGAAGAGGAGGTGGVGGRDAGRGESRATRGAAAAGGGASAQQYFDALVGWMPEQAAGRPRGLAAGAGERRGRVGGQAAVGGRGVTFEPAVSGPEADESGESRRWSAGAASILEVEEANLHGGLSLVTEVADRLVAVLEYRDPYFRGASSLTRVVAVETGRALGLPEARLDELALAAVLRDAGRLAVGNRLFPKGRTELTESDRERVRRHVDLGLQLLDDIPLPGVVRRAIKHHHERWDGRGYPAGLRETRIPLFARIIAVADAFAAMIRPRQHRLPRRTSDAMEELRREAGHQFDPAVVAATLDLLVTRDLRYFGLGLLGHILVVHPEATRASVLATRLCSAGHLAEVMRDTATAMQRTGQVPVEAILLSADFPVGATLDFVRTLRADPRRSGLPILLLEAGDPRRATALVAAGVDAVFAPSTPFSQVRAGLTTLLGRTARTGGGAPPDPLHALGGALQDFGLGWLLQMIGYHGRTAALAVDSPSGQGVVYLVQGEPHHAEALGLEGEKALRAMLGWQEGTFAVYLDREPPRRTLNRSLMNLLLDQAVDQDHEAWTTYGAMNTE